MFFHRSEVLVGVVVQHERSARCRKVKPYHEDMRLLLVLEAALGLTKLLGIKKKLILLSCRNLM